MHFGSTKSARLATENLKSVRSDLNIRSNHETAYASEFLLLKLKVQLVIFKS